MNTFTDVYGESREVLKTETFDTEWKVMLDGLRSMLGADGPVEAKGEELDKLRKKLKEDKSWYQFSNSYMADQIVKASLVDTRGFQKRCAFLKAMRHFYVVAKKGSQAIWVMDSPSKYRKWSYDELAGLSKDKITDRLAESGEVFGEGNRKMMSDAFQHARKWCADIEVALSKGDAELRKKVQRWFHEAGASDGEIDASIAKLSTGFKAMHAACNSGKVIFSDRPHLRTSGTYDDTYASVNAGDKMPVIYIYELFLVTGRRTFFGNIPKMWLCALTVVHELSHKLASTDDIHYDSDGLRPGSSGFSAAQAIKNADSWAYFAADVVNAVSKATISDVLK